MVILVRKYEKAKGLVANLVAVRVRLLGAQQGQRVRGVGLRECIVCADLRPPFLLAWSTDCS